MLVVADSSPLIYRSRSRLVHILPTLCGDVVVPKAVWNETVERRPSAPGIENLRQASWIRIVAYVATRKPRARKALQQLLLIGRP